MSDPSSQLSLTNDAVKNRRVHKTRVNFFSRKRTTINADQLNVNKNHDEKSDKIINELGKSLKPVRSRQICTQSIEKEYNDSASSYNKRWKSYTRKTIHATMTEIQHLLDNFDIPSFESVLDVGCGTGALTSALASSQLFQSSSSSSITGIDTSRGMILQAEHALSSSQHEVVSFQVSSATNLPLKDDSFDMVVSSSSMHYWTDAAKGLSEMIRVAKPNKKGLVVISDWCNDYCTIRAVNLYLRLRGFEPGKTLSSKILGDMFRDAGLVDIHVKKVRIGWKWGFMVVSGRKP